MAFSANESPQRPPANHKLNWKHQFWNLFKNFFYLTDTGALSVLFLNDILRWKNWQNLLLANFKKRWTKNHSKTFWRVTKVRVLIIDLDPHWPKADFFGLPTDYLLALPSKLNVSKERFVPHMSDAESNRMT